MVILENYRGFVLLLEVLGMLCNCLQLKAVFMQLLEVRVCQCKYGKLVRGLGLGQCNWVGLMNSDGLSCVCDWTQICSETGLKLVREINSQVVLKKLGRVVTISIIDMLDVVGLTQPNQISLKSYAGDISMISCNLGILVWQAF